MRRPRAVHACGALRLVDGCTRRHNNEGDVTAGQAPHNSSNVGVVTGARLDTTLVVLTQRRFFIVLLCAFQNERTQVITTNLWMVQVRALKSFDND